MWPTEAIAIRAYEELYERRPEFFPFVPLEGMQLARCRAWFALLIGKSGFSVWIDPDTGRCCFGRPLNDRETEVYTCTEETIMDQAMIAAVEIGWSWPNKTLDDLEALIRSVFADMGLSPPPPIARRQERLTWEVTFIPGIGSSARPKSESSPDAE